MAHIDLGYNQCISIHIWIGKNEFAVLTNLAKTMPVSFTYPFVGTGIPSFFNTILDILPDLPFFSPGLRRR